MKDALSGDMQRVRSLELIAYVARRPRFFCGCICLSREDRRRARRVFRIVRRTTQAWEREREAREADQDQPVGRL